MILLLALQGSFVPQLLLKKPKVLAELGSLCAVRHDVTHDGYQQGDRSGDQGRRWQFLIHSGSVRRRERCISPHRVGVSAQPLQRRVRDSCKSRLRTPASGGF